MSESEGTTAANEDLEAPTGLFHSIFGDWEGDTAKSEGELQTRTEWEEDFHLKDKITITDLKNGQCNGLKEQLHGLGFRVKREQLVPKAGLIFKPEQFFDKTYCRERLKCPHCYFLTDNGGNLKQHMKVHQRTEGGMIYICEFCDFQTKYRNSIKGHVQRHAKSKKAGKKLKK